MFCSICSSSINLASHGNNVYCSTCIDENWCSNDIDHCCECKTINVHVDKYNNKTYCDNCIASIKNPGYVCVECGMCKTNSLENINNKLYCDNCATRITKIKKCDKCNVRHLKTVCMYDERYDTDYNIYADICDVCNRYHIYQNDCKYCEECFEYFPLDYEHCGYCGDCGPPYRQH
jgi:hypothetical protein